MNCHVPLAHNIQKHRQYHSTCIHSPVPVTCMRFCNRSYAYSCKEPSVQYSAEVSDTVQSWT
jgi:hypothetical protein